MQPPPPLMRGPMLMDRRRLVGLMIILGLFLLLVGGVLSDLSRTRAAGAEPPEEIGARENLGLVPRRRRRILRHLGAVPRRLHRRRRIVDHDRVAHRAAVGGRAHPDLRLLSVTFQASAAT